MDRDGIASQSHGPFENEAGKSIVDLKCALGRLVDSLPGARVSRPSELASLLMLDTMLSWKIWKVITEPDPFVAALYVPGASGVRQFLRAARKHKAGDDTLIAARQAYEAFQNLIRTHAGDRKSFDMLLAGHATADRARVDLEHRRGAFRHLSYLWGVQAKAHIYSLLLRPSASAAGYFDVAAVRGFIDLRRIRPNVPWRIARCYTVDDAGALRTEFVREPLDPGTDSTIEGSELPLLRAFCSQPLPECRRVSGLHGEVEYQLVEGKVGNTGLLTCITGEVIRAAEPCHRDEAHQDLVLQAYVRTPCEVLLFDMLIDRRLFGDFHPELRAYSALFLGDLNAKPAECDRLPIHEKIEPLGSGISGLHATEAPRYADMIGYALRRLDWSPDDFDAYRIRMEYPPTPISVRVYHPLPDMQAAVKNSHERG